MPNGTLCYILLSNQSSGRKVCAFLWKNRPNFEIVSQFKFEYVKFGYFDLKNPRKVLLHKMIRKKTKST